jgi:hypothetical protein
VPEQVGRPRLPGHGGQAAKEKSRLGQMDKNLAEAKRNAMFLRRTSARPRAGDDFMSVVEIEVENIGQYHKKGVIAHIMTDTGPMVHEGVFFVGADAKWLRIDFFAGKDAQGNPLVRPFYVTQEIAESIVPASREVLNSYEGRVAFMASAKRERRLWGESRICLFSEKNAAGLPIAAHDRRTYQIGLFEGVFAVECNV